MRIVFLGNPEFAVASLKAIVEGGRHQVVGVVTMPDRVGGRGHHAIISDVKRYAQDSLPGVPILQPDSLKDSQFIEQLQSLRADLFVVIAFRMLPREVWQMPSMGTFNLHASLLPRYRGAAPLNWAVINGDTRTGVTTFLLKHELDTGDVLQRQAIEIGPEEDVGTIHDKLMLLGAELTVRTLDSLQDGTARPVPQEEMTDVQPAPAPKIHKETCRVDWKQPARRVHDLVRGLSPAPGAWSRLRTDASAPADVKILQCRLCPAIKGDAAPGTVIVTDDGRLTVACGQETAIEILSLQAPGKRRMDAGQWLRGQRWRQATFADDGVL